MSVAAPPPPVLPSAVRTRWSPGRVQRLAKRVVLGVLVVALLAAMGLLLFTSTGRTLLDNPHLFQADVQRLVAHHPLLSPLLLLAVYIPLAVLALPVWWLQVLAGLGLGLWMGTFWSLIGTIAAAMLTVWLTRWLAADWVRGELEPKMERFRKLNTTLGHNGFLVVMTLRLIHLLPFGLCNYALGLSRVSMMDVLVGTGLGSIPAVATYVATGAGLRPWRNWHFTVVVGTLNVLLLLPLLLRYLRPQWFRKIGVE